MRVESEGERRGEGKPFLPKKDNIHNNRTSHTYYF